ncbi:MAG: hypothetical protein GXY44_03085 [Phycisphaerales bacterium]|nr:hypothetical protein [Phycisphaerales bacterium]
MVLKLHKNLDQTSWSRYPACKRIIMIVNELQRASNCIEHNDLAAFRECYERAFELIDLEISNRRNHSALREMFRLREIMGETYLSDAPNIETNRMFLSAVLSFDVTAYNMLS